MTDFILVLFVIVGSVTSYALGYFRERKVIDPPRKDPDLPKEGDASLKILLEAYGEEVRAKYLRNHGRRRADKFLKEFTLVSFHFILFVALAITCAVIEPFAHALSAMEILTGLSFLTMGLKAGQLTAAKETVNLKEELLIHQVEVVNDCRRNMMTYAPRELWIHAIQVRDEKSPMHY